MNKTNIALSPNLRHIIADDCDAVFGWRNASETRRHFSNAARISYQDHITWFKKTLSNPDCAYLIGEAGEKPLGVLRYDIDGCSAAVSIYLVPGTSGKGHGTALLKSGNAWVARHRPEVTNLRALVRPDNLASQKVFEKSGFQMIGATAEYCEFDFEISAT